MFRSFLTAIEHSSCRAAVGRILAFQTKELEILPEHLGAHDTTITFLLWSNDMIVSVDGVFAIDVHQN